MSIESLVKVGINSTNIQAQLNLQLNKTTFYFKLKTLSRIYQFHAKLDLMACDILEFLANGLLKTNEAVSLKLLPQL